jgi:hypothetical protein
MRLSRSLSARPSLLLGAWLMTAFLVAFTVTPQLYPACNQAVRNWGLVQYDGCFPSGSCEYPEYCDANRCTNLTCNPPNYGWNDFCVLFTYCHAFYPCLNGCPPAF